jgi:hypothetical protein
MVPLHVDGDSATAGADVTPVTCALRFERGAMTRTVTMDVRDDPEDAPREERLSVHPGASPRGGFESAPPQDGVVPARGDQRVRMRPGSSASR